MVKEAMFSSIAIYSDTSFLDLFSGSGAIGIEALSRGAADVVFNDSNAQAVKIIKANLDKVHEKAKVHELDYRQCLEKEKGHHFDIIFCDPPYAFESYDTIFSLVGEYDVLAKDGIIILEVRKNTDLKEAYANMHKYKEKRYGISKLLYYAYEEISYDQSNLSGNF